MTDEKRGGSIEVGSVSGTGIAIGHGASARVTITQGERDELEGRFEELRELIEGATLSSAVKEKLLTGVIPKLRAGADAQDSQEKVGGALERLDDVLSGVTENAATLTKIASVAKSIAGLAKVAFTSVAPFLARIIIGV